MPNGLSKSLLSVVANILKLYGMPESTEMAKGIKVGE